MRIYLAHIHEGGRPYEGEEPPEILALEDDPILRTRSPVRYDLVAEVVDHELLVRGRVETDLEALCSRCGEFFSTTVCDSSFLRAYELSGEVDTVDLNADLREAILLKTSQFPLCSPDCLGICPQCGANLNERPCDCRPPTTEGGAWGVLDDLDV
jgi:uncharacterized protein